jgi:hypothetical protein
VAPNLHPPLKDEKHGIFASLMDCKFQCHVFHALIVASSWQNRPQFEASYLPMQLVPERSQV